MELIIEITVKFTTPDLFKSLIGPKSRILHIIVLKFSQNSEALLVRDFFGPKLVGPRLEIECFIVSYL